MDGVTIVRYRWDQESNMMVADTIDPLDFWRAYVPSAPLPIVNPKTPPTEEEKAIHRAMSFDGGDEKRFGHGPVFGSDK